MKLIIVLSISLHLKINSCTLNSFKKKTYDYSTWGGRKLFTKVDRFNLSDELKVTSKNRKNLLDDKKCNKRIDML
jgi:hypothetical protein